MLANKSPSSSCSVVNVTIDSAEETYHMCSGSCVNSQQTCSSSSGEVVGKRYLKCNSGKFLFKFLTILKSSPTLVEAIKMPFDSRSTEYMYFF